MKLDFNIVFDCRIGGIYVLSVKHRCRASIPLHGYELRRTYSFVENKYAPPMRSKKKIGNTTFIVNSFFPQTGNQTIASKLENLIKADIQKQTVT